MIYKCNICNYTARDSDCLNRHLKTSKHKKMVDEQKNKSQLSISKNECKYCNITFSTFSSLTRHIKICSVYKKQNFDEEKNKFVEENQKLLNENKQKDNDLKNKTDELEKLKIMNKDLVEQNKNLIDIMAATVHDTVPSAFSYVCRYYNNAPEIKEFTDIESIHNGMNKGEFVDFLVTKYSNGHLVQYLSELILDKYKCIDPTQQSIWNSDASRLTYIIKKDPNWKVDKNGVDTTTLIVNPILDYIKEILRDHLENLNTLKVAECTYQKTTKLLYKLQKITDISSLIRTGKLATDILKYLADRLYVENRLTKVDKTLT